MSSLFAREQNDNLGPQMLAISLISSARWQGCQLVRSYIITMGEINQSLHKYTLWWGQWGTRPMGTIVSTVDIGEESRCRCSPMLTLPGLVTQRTMQSNACSLLLLYRWSRASSPHPRDWDALPRNTSTTMSAFHPIPSHPS